MLATKKRRGHSLGPETGFKSVYLIQQSTSAL